MEKNGTNPVDGSPLKASDLIKLNFAKNDDKEYVDPVTYKVFTDNTHIVTLRNTGNVFSWDTVERLNIKAKNWQDLVSDDAFTRKDIITLQDPQNVESRNLSAFKYLKDGEKAGAQSSDHVGNINADALGNAAKIIKAKEAVAKARAERANGVSGDKSLVKGQGAAGKTMNGSNISAVRKPAYNAATYTTGQAAASFTSTGVSVHTGNDRAILTDEEYMLKPKRVKNNGYAHLRTNYGELTLELYPENAPKAVWNFVQLAKKGYYRNQIFHRNIRSFMLQGGDPTGSGRGGQSIWGKNFQDEFEGPLRHDARGMLSMANKGKNTNSSQFFITYRPAKHLDLKHTIFGRVVGGLDVLAKLEAVQTDDKDRPVQDIKLEDINVFVDPFEEFLKQRAENEQEEKEKEKIKAAGGTEDDKMTWTGKRVRKDGVIEQSSSVGKYLRTATLPAEEDEVVGYVDDVPEPPAKKAKKGGFGNFDGW